MVRSMFSLPSYFYPRSPRGERLLTAAYRGPSTSISIHAPREGSDITPLYLP